MSPQVIATPEELENFAKELQRFNDQLRDSTSRLKGQFHRLGETWRDQEHYKFAQEYEQTMRTLEHFMRSADQQAELLRRKARILDQYNKARQGG